MGQTIKLIPQKIYAVVIVYMLSFTALLNLINSLLNMVGLQTTLDTMVLYGVMIVLVLLGLLMFLWDSRRVPLDVFAVVILFTASYFMSYFLFSANRPYLVTSLSEYDANPLYLVFVYSLPGFVFVRKLTDYEYLQKVLVVFSYVVVCMSIVVFFFGGTVHGKQYMTFSYNMLFQLFVLLFHKPQKMKWLHITILVVGIFVFVFGGARGALVSFLVSLVLFNVFTIKLNRRTILQLVAVVVLVVMYVFFKDQLISLVVDLLKSFSIESRTFEYLLQGIFFDDSNRLSIYETSLANVNLFGLGMRGDRVVLGGSYVHNLFIELWLHFGWILGTVIIGVLLAVLFGGMKNKHKPEQFYVFMLLSNGFLGLLVSGSYLNQAPAFFVLFGFCMSSIFRKEQTASRVLQ